MAANNVDQLLDSGIAAARAGENEAARQLLEQVIRLDGNNELAWIWLASVVPTVDERRICLERVLEINPRNERAREALIKLVGIGGTGKVDPRAVQQGAARQRALPPEPSSSGGNANVLLGALVILIMLGLVALAATLTSPEEQIVTPSPIPLVAIRATQTTFREQFITPSDTVEPTFPGVAVTRRITPTPPPTFTPTATNTPTITPTPTLTPFPQQAFTLLYTARGQADVHPLLFRTDGAGNNTSELLRNARDVTYDLRRERIAFVRDIELPPEFPEGDPITFSEVFIAPVDDLDAARQLTTLGGNTSSPTFSPDSRFVVFANDFDGDDDLYVWNLTDDNVTAITRNTITDRDPHWSYDGRHIVFSSNRSATDPIAQGLHLITLGTGPNPFEGLTVEPLVERRSNLFAPQFAPDNRRIAYVDDAAGTGDIFIYDLETGRDRQLTRDEGAEDRYPVWTPDARLVVFLSNRVGDRFQVYSIDPDEREVQRVLRTDSDVQSIAYRPDLRFRVQFLD